MALKLVKRNKLPVDVSGKLIGEAGEDVGFSFKLNCKRLTQAQVDKELKDKNGSVKDFLFNVTEGWEGMLDEEGKEMEYSISNFDEMLNEHAGLHSVCYQAYLKAVGATPKN